MWSMRSQGIDQPGADSVSAERLPDDHDRVARQTWREFAHVGGRNRDAAGGRRKTNAREMEENCAASPFSAPREVLVKHECQVVDMVLAPHSVGAVSRGEAHRPIVTRA
jgi:hypothetical protein